MARGPTKVQHHEPSGRHPTERVKLHTVHSSSIDGSGNPVESLLESSIAGKTLKIRDHKFQWSSSVYLHNFYCK